MTSAASHPKRLGLSIMIGIAIGTLAAILSSHVAVWLIAGVFVGIAAGAAIGRKQCPDCEAREHAGVRSAATSSKYRTDG
jgi:4-hydroxybenzoate polyprenyltransferase